MEIVDENYNMLYFTGTKDGVKEAYLCYGRSGECDAFSIRTTDHDELNITVTQIIIQIMSRG